MLVYLYYRFMIVSNAEANNSHHRQFSLTNLSLFDMCMGMYVRCIVTTKQPNKNKFPLSMQLKQCFCLLYGELVWRNANSTVLKAHRYKIKTDEHKVKKEKDSSSALHTRTYIYIHNHHKRRTSSLKRDWIVYSARVRKSFRSCRRFYF